MIISAGSRSSYSSGNYHQSLSPVGNALIKSVAFAALCGVVITIVMKLYVAFVIVGLIAITSLAIKHLSKQKIAYRSDPRNSQMIVRTSKSAHVATPRQKIRFEQPTNQQTQDELDALENSSKKIKARIDTLRKFDDNPWEKVPDEARNNPSHPYWEKRKK